MKKTIIILVVVAIAVAVYLHFVRKNKEQNKSTSDASPQVASYSGTTTIAPTTGSTLSSVGSEVVLKNGSRGTEVLRMQEMYNEQYASERHLTKLAEDGIFGSKTEAAIFEAFGVKQLTFSQFETLLSAASFFNFLYA